jgi:2-amino-4-hydroxy-6-hydroxymethyldihydropteridine diphosphokinase
MAQVVFSIGSNMGNRSQHLAHAVEHLQQLGELHAISSTYETPAVGFDSNNRFFNQCLIMNAETHIKWKKEIAFIEEKMGRVRTTGYADRIIDIDILFTIPAIETAGLNVPHPRMHTRAFVIYPLHEIKSYLNDLQWQKRIEKWKQELPVNTEIYRIKHV